MQVSQTAPPDLEEVAVVMCAWQKGHVIVMGFWLKRNRWSKALLRWRTKSLLRRRCVALWRGWSVPLALLNRKTLLWCWSIALVRGRDSCLLFKRGTCSISRWLGRHSDCAHVLCVD